jgi:hypothetical protein
MLPPDGTIHLNAETALIREHHADLFFQHYRGSINMDDPAGAELFCESEFGKSDTVSGLTGFIWREAHQLVSRLHSCGFISAAEFISHCSIGQDHANARDFVAKVFLVGRQKF